MPSLGIHTVFGKYMDGPLELLNLFLYVCRYFTTLHCANLMVAIIMPCPSQSNSAYIPVMMTFKFFSS